MPASSTFNSPRRATGQSSVTEKEKHSNNKPEETAQKGVGRVSNLSKLLDPKLLTAANENPVRSESSDSLSSELSDVDSFEPQETPLADSQKTVEKNSSIETTESANATPAKGTFTCDVCQGPFKSMKNVDRHRYNKACIRVFKTMKGVSQEKIADAESKHASLFGPKPEKQGVEAGSRSASPVVSKTKKQNTLAPIKTRAGPVEEESAVVEIPKHLVAGTEPSKEPSAEEQAATEKQVSDNLQDIFPTVTHYRSLFTGTIVPVNAIQVTEAFFNLGSTLSKVLNINIKNLEGHEVMLIDSLHKMDPLLREAALNCYRRGCETFSIVPEPSVKKEMPLDEEMAASVATNLDRQNASTVIENFDVEYAQKEKESSQSTGAADNFFYSPQMSRVPSFGYSSSSSQGANNVNEPITPPAKRSRYTFEQGQLERLDAFMMDGLHWP